jgi:serine/threonine-protein kinase
MTGSPVVVVDRLFGSSFVGAGQFAVSSEGSLAYLPDNGFQSQVSLMWVNRKGDASPVGDVKRSYTAARLSPDGTRIAVHVDDGDSDVWVYEPARGTLSRVTYRPEFEGNPVWTTDGTRIVFASDRGPGLQLFWKRWDDPRKDEPLAPGSYARVPHSWSPDGSFLAFTENHPETRRDIWILPAGAGAKPYPFLVSPFEDNQPSFSPDGKWLAYHSNESGLDEVYVRPFPGPGPRLQISSGGGSSPKWSKRGELFFRQGSVVAMVAITAGPDGLRAGPEKRLFEGDYLGEYDVSPDGQRLLMVRREAAQDRTHLIFAQDWPGDLGR